MTALIGALIAEWLLLCQQHHIFADQCAVRAWSSPGPPENLLSPVRPALGHCGYSRWTNQSWPMPSFWVEPDWPGEGYTLSA
jgi:hypothetical protein